MAKFDLLNKDLMHYVEVTLNNESVRTEAGAARYWRGNIQMQSKMPSVGGMIKSAMTGNKVFRPVYTGTGKVMLAPRFHEFIGIQLNKERYVLERGAYWASDMGIEVDLQVNSLSAGMFSGEGFIQTAVQGTGVVIACSPGPVEVFDLKEERLTLDGAYAVARSASLRYTVQQSTRSIIGMVTSGQGLVQVVEGTGRVYLSPVPNHSVALEQVVTDSIMSCLEPKKS
jgi:uncharacterized protein (AIM24 family)